MQTRRGGRENATYQKDKVCGFLLVTAIIKALVFGQYWAAACTPKKSWVVASADQFGLSCCHYRTSLAWLFWVPDTLLIPIAKDPDSKLNPVTVFQSLWRVHYQT